MTMKYQQPTNARLACSPYFSFTAHVSKMQKAMNSELSTVNKVYFNNISIWSRNGLFKVFPRKYLCLSYMLSGKSCTTMTRNRSHLHKAPVGNVALFTCRYPGECREN
jgi:hypothetical protein